MTTTILALVPRKQPGDTKYSASVLVVGGAPGLTGAACLAAEAAFRADAGYVAVAAPAESLPVLEARLLEAVKRPLEEVFDAVGKAGALAIGPGLGRGRGQTRARAEAARGDRPAGRRRRRRALRARAGSAFGADGADAACRRARRTARRGVRVGRCPPLRCRAAGGRHVRLCLPAEGGGHARRGAWAGRPRVRRAGRRRLRRPAPGTCLRARWPRSSRRAWAPARLPQPPPLPAPRRRGSVRSEASSPRTSSMRCRTH